MYIDAWSIRCILNPLDSMNSLLHVSMCFTLTSLCGHVGTLVYVCMYMCVSKLHCLQVIVNCCRHWMVCVCAPSVCTHVCAYVCVCLVSACVCEQTILFFLLCIGTEYFYYCSGPSYYHVVDHQWCFRLRKPYSGKYIVWSYTYYVYGHIYYVC